MIFNLPNYAHKNIAEACEKLQQHFINDVIDVINPWLGMVNRQEVTVKVSSLPKHVFRRNSNDGIWYGYIIWNLPSYTIGDLPCL